MIVEQEYTCPNNIVVEVHHYNEESSNPEEHYYNVVAFDASDWQEDEFGLDSDWDFTEHILKETACQTLEEAEDLAREYAKEYGLDTGNQND